MYRFNKRRENFLDLKAYNDYLEEVEDISESNIVPKKNMNDLVLCSLQFD
jgi:hypothetical protein